MLNRFPSRASMLLVAFAGFLLIGLPEGVLGTAWPEIRASLGRSTSDLGAVLIAYTSGYLVSSVISGHLAERLGLGRALATAAAIGAVGALVFALTGAWVGLLVGAAMMAIGSGMTDSGLNAYLTLHHDASAMNLAHGVFGIGATLGPLAIEATLRGGGTWEAAYIGMAVLSGVVSILYLLHRPLADSTPQPVEADVGDGRRARWLLVVLLVVFFFYVGVEVSVGAWSFSLLTESRGVGDTLGRIAVAGFWGGLTVGRLTLGSIGRRLELRAVLRWSVIGIGVSVALIWIDPFPGADVISLPLGGLAMAGVFPALVLLTPRWLGSGRTARVVGYQLAASSAGAIVAAALTRELVDARGEGAIGPSLVIAAVGLVASFAVLDRLAPRTRATAAVGR